MKHLILGAVLLFAFPAFAGSIQKTPKSDWRLGTYNTKGTLYWIKGMTPEGNGKWSYWQKVIKGEADVDQDGLVTFVSRYSLDCKAQKVRTLSLVTYDRDDRVVDTFEKPTYWRSITPDSMMDEIQARVCGKTNDFL